MKPRVCRVGKPEGSHQLLKVIKEAAVSIRNKPGSMQWHYSGAQYLIQCLQSILETYGAYFEIAMKPILNV
jgi:hypothetical protein